MTRQRDACPICGWHWGDHTARELSDHTGQLAGQVLDLINAGREERNSR